MVKPMALEQGRLIKSICTGTAQPATYEGTEEAEGMANALIKCLLKDIIKKQAPEVIEMESRKSQNHQSRKSHPRNGLLKSGLCQRHPNLCPAVIKHRHIAVELSLKVSLPLLKKL